jgi:hypothetical protein
VGLVTPNAWTALALTKSDADFATDASTRTML